VSGTGTLDLSDVDLDLAENLTITTNLITDVSTDVNTGRYTLEWQYDGYHPFDGTIRIDENGVFTIIGPAEADISADIYLTGGTLDVDVTTDLSGTIYHEASSTIDILGGVSLNYTGNDVSVDALTLTLAGDGIMANRRTLTLNDDASRLLFAANGQLWKATADSTTDTSLAVQGAYSIADLALTYPLLVDVSPDAELTLTHSLDVLHPASFHTRGAGSLLLDGLRADSTVDVSSLAGVTVAGDLDVSGDGILDAEGITFTVDSATALHLSGDGTVDLTNSDIDLKTDLFLSMSSPGDISSDSDTH
jgi:hypothetical protein